MGAATIYKRTAFHPATQKMKSHLTLSEMKAQLAKFLSKGKVVQNEPCQLLRNNRTNIKCSTKSFFGFLNFFYFVKPVRNRKMMSKRNTK